MTFKSRLWEPIAWTLTGINLVSVWFAVLPGEPLHATSHAVLAALFALWAQRLRRRGKDAGPNASRDERLSELEARFNELDKLPDVQSRLAELEERLDFTERALVDVRTRAQFPPKA